MTINRRQAFLPLTIGAVIGALAMLTLLAVTLLLSTDGTPTPRPSTPAASPSATSKPPASPTSSPSPRPASPTSTAPIPDPEAPTTDLTEG